MGRSTMGHGAPRLQCAIFVRHTCAIYGRRQQDGTLLVLGVNIRAYDDAKRQWNIKWLNGLSGTWLDLSREELGGVSVQDRSISYVFKETIADHAYTRATYTAQSRNHWTWRGERSEDREHWHEFMVIEADRP
jgi:hypothetical protein